MLHEDCAADGQVQGFVLPFLSSPWKQCELSFDHRRLTSEFAEDRRVDPPFGVTGLVVAGWRLSLRGLVPPNPSPTAHPPVALPKKAKKRHYESRGKPPGQACVDFRSSIMGAWQAPPPSTQTFPLASPCTPKTQANTHPGKLKFLSPNAWRESQASHVWPLHRNNFLTLVTVAEASSLERSPGAVRRRGSLPSPSG